MIMPVEHFIDACLAGDLAAHLSRLPVPELQTLHAYAADRVRENPAKGGIPAVLKWACALEAANRFLTTPTSQPQ